ncbi:MAG: hypothetical protein WA996_00470 [Candidatus Promineifilaceae bacterium]
MTPDEKSNRSSQRLLIGVALSVLVITLLAIGLISAGAFDPKPLGQLAYRVELNRQVAVVDEFQEQLVQRPSSDEFSVRFSAALSSGNSDIGYGLKIGDTQSSIIVGVSPLGYVTIMEHLAQHNAPELDGQRFDETEHILPWQTWPHVAGGTASNEIWVDIMDSKLVSVRMNRELLWTGALPLASTEIGFWAESYDAPAAIDLNYVELYIAP